MKLLAVEEDFVAAPGGNYLGGRQNIPERVLQNLGMFVAGYYHDANLLVGSLLAELGRRFVVGLKQLVARVAVSAALLFDEQVGDAGALQQRIEKRRRFRQHGRR